MRGFRLHASRLLVRVWRAKPLLLFAMLLFAFTVTAQESTPTPAIPFADQQSPAQVIAPADDPRQADCLGFREMNFSPYVVQAGDRLKDFARDQVTVTELAVLNCIDNPDALPVGAVIFIPVWDPPTPAPCTADWLPGAGAEGVCPEVARAVYAVYQPFENGVMIWFSDTELMHILYGNGRLEVWTDQFVEGMPQPTLTAPEGLRVPERGFGLLWRSLGLDDDLGYALEAEVGYDLLRQPAGERSFTTYITTPDERTLALTRFPGQEGGFWAEVTPED